MNQPFRIAVAALAAISALVGVTTPASAQPIEITVPGGAVEPAPLVPSDRVVLPSRLFDYHLEFDNRFDPGRAAIDAQPLVRTGLSINPVRTVVLNRNRLSLAEHQLLCQSLYPSYEPVSDTYLDLDGIPRNCVY
jgi:hypothetical protein